MLGMLSADRSVLLEFVQDHFNAVTDASSSKPSFLVVLMKDYSVIMRDASDDSRGDEYVGLCDREADMYGWALLRSEVEAVSLHEKLLTIDKQLALPDIETVRSVAASAKSRASLPVVSMDAAATPTSRPPVVNPYAKKPAAPLRGGTSSSVAKFGVEFVDTNDPSSPPRISGTSEPSSSPPTNVLAPLDMSSMNLAMDTNAMNEIGTGIKMKVSGVIPHARHGRGYTMSFITFPDLLYYADGKFLKTRVDPFIREHFTKKGQAPPMYLASLGDIAMCQPSNPHEYKRTKKNWTISVATFTNEFPLNGASAEAHVKTAFSNIASGYKADGNAGAHFAAFVKANKGNLYRRETGVDGSKKTISHDQYANLLQTRLVKAFKNVSIDWNVPLASVITFGHIKKFLMETCGYSHWSEIPANVKDYIVGSSSSYPEWDDCSVKPYSV